MDIEKLTKGELITAGLLISFVTAILTGAVIILLSEDAPKDVIRVSERIVTTDTSTSSGSATDTADSIQVDENNVSRDDILSAATEAVARVTAEAASPRAGVLLRLDGQLSVITSSGELSSGPQALFQDGVVVDLSLTASTNGFSVLSLVDTGEPVYPLAVSGISLAEGMSLYLVPLSELPEIVSVKIESIQQGLIYTNAGSLPSVSLLLDKEGALVGVYNAEVGAFQSISTFMAQ